MDSKLLLVRVITLLYKESVLGTEGNRSISIVNEAIDQIKLPETGADFDRSREVMVALRTTAKWMADNPEGTQYDKTSLLQRIRVNVVGDEWLYEACAQGIEDGVVPEDLKHQASQIRHELYEHVNRTKLTEVMQRQARRLVFQPETVPDLRTYIQEVENEIEPFRHIGGEGRKVAGELGEIDFSKPEDITREMEKGLKEVGSEGILRTGWQALNRMTGYHNGLRRGEMIVVGALQHNFKTGFLLSTFIHVALYNTPWMQDPEKKPLLLFVTLENELQQNVMWMYTYLKEIETGQMCDISHVSMLTPDEQQAFYREASEYVMGKLTATGYHVIMKRMNPSDTTYMSFFDMLDQYEEEFETHLCAIDYLPMMNKAGCEMGPAGQEIRDLYRRFRNKLAPMGTVTLTAHQLSPSAKMLVRGNVEDLVKEVANKGYYDGCSKVDQEVDMEIYIHKVIVNGRSYLTVQQGKHRKLRPTEERYKYFVLPFHDIGAIHPDLLGKDTSTRRPGSNDEGSIEAMAW